MRHVYFICNYAAAYGGNFLESLKSLEERLKEENIRVTYVLPIGAQGKEWTEDLTVQYCVFTPMELYKVVKQLEPGGLVHTHFLSWKEEWMIRLACGRRLTLVHQEHMRWDFYQNGKVFKDFLRRHLWRLAFHGVPMIGVSQAVCEDLQRYLPRNPVYCVENAISTKRLLGERQNSRQRNALLLGTHFLRKGGDLAVKAWQDPELYRNMTLNLISHRPAETWELIAGILGEKSDLGGAFTY